MRKKQNIQGVRNELNENFILRCNNCRDKRVDEGVRLLLMRKLMRFTHFNLVMGLIPIFALMGFGHPGDGLDVDSKGNIYITDVHRKSVWKIGSDGKPTALLKEHWSHGLCVDALDRVWVEVEVDNTHYSIVRIETNGQSTTILGPIKRGQDLYGVNILADLENNLYFPHSNPPNKFAIGIRKRSPEGIVTLIAGDNTFGHKDGFGPEAQFEGIQSMRFGSDQWIYVVDRVSIRRISLSGHVETLYRDILLEHPEHQPFDNGNPSVSNRVYGLDIEPESGDILVAYHGNRSVLRFNKEGRQRIYQSKKPWSPVGVAVAKNGILVKESGLEPGSDQTGPRVRLISPDNTVQTIVEIQ